MPWKCFMVRATDRRRSYLRRYSWDKCPLPNGYHDARSFCRVVPASTVVEVVTDEDKSTLNWPRSCLCGYVFKDTDEWQHFPDLIFDDELGREWSSRELPPGAMYEAPWLDVKPLACDGTYTGPHLLVVLPGSPVNIWNLTGPSSSGGGWSVTGTPPALTVSPSIATPRYHGHLIGGFLTDDCEGRKFPPPPVV